MVEVPKNAVGPSTRYRAARSVNTPPRVPCGARGVKNPARPINIVTMDRRTFVLLTGAGSAALIRPPDRQSPGPPWADGRTSGRAVGRLRFELDDHHRWSLWYYGEG